MLDNNYPNEPLHPIFVYSPIPYKGNDQTSLGHAKSLLSPILIEHPSNLFMGVGIDHERQAIRVEMRDIPENRELLRSICEENDVSHPVVVFNIGGPYIEHIKTQGIYPR